MELLWEALNDVIEFTKGGGRYCGGGRERREGESGGAVSAKWLPIPHPSARGKNRRKEGTSGCSRRRSSKQKKKREREKKSKVDIATASFTTYPGTRGTDRANDGWRLTVD